MSINKLSNDIIAIILSYNERLKVLLCDFNCINKQFNCVVRNYKPVRSNIYFVINVDKIKSEPLTLVNQFQKLKYVKQFELNLNYEDNFGVNFFPKDRTVAEKIYSIIIK